MAADDKSESQTTAGKNKEPISPDDQSMSDSDYVLEEDTEAGMSTPTARTLVKSNVSDQSAAQADDDDATVEAIKVMWESETGIPLRDGSQSTQSTLKPEDTGLTSTPRFLGWIQVRAMLAKSLLTMYRTPLPTFFEIFSPVLMMLILVAAYSLSEVSYRNAQLYSSVELDLPGPWLDLAGRAVDLISVGQGDLAGFVGRRALEKEEASKPQPVDFRRILQSLDNGANISGGFDGDIFGLLDDAQNQISGILRNPIPVPTFDQFVSISLAVSSVVDADALPRILSDSNYGRQWGNLLTLGTLHLSPNTQRANDFWAYLNGTYPDLTSNAIKIRMHESEAEAVEFISSNLSERTWALLNFDELVPDDNDFRYKIRMNYTTLPNTNEITNFVSIGLNTRYQQYYLSGYLTLQRTLNEFAFSQLDGGQCNVTDDAIPNMWSMPMPTAAYSQNSFYSAVGYLLGLTIALAFLYPTSRLIKQMVEEKETRMKETLLILGVRQWAHWLSWVLISLLTYFIIAVLVTWVLSSQVLKYSSPSYLFAFIGLFSTSTIGFSFVVASFFSRAKLAAIVGPIALFATLLPRFIFFGSNRYEATTAKKFASLLPCTAFAFGADIVADYEYAEQGIQSWNASEGDYSFNTTLGFLLLDTILYMFLGWYLELVIPRQYGVARKWYFIFLPSYWWSVLTCGCSSTASPSPPETMDLYLSEGESTNVSANSDSNVEPVTDSSLVPGVRIEHLVKRYNNKKDTPPAVNDLNLVMYESQVTCLLGHNGAGKSSTISVLTGLFPPTSGDCIVYGNSVIHNINEARQSMGICPQHNVLFERLTVLEHIAFFQRIKGIKPTSSGVRESAAEIGLGEYFQTTSSALSGGNKRKLCVAISLSGDPKFLLLDEPTSGMDPASRRACWELIRKKRQGRVTLLTTHFMDEAELLADRIAIMSVGKLQVCGSGLFLKNKYGLGYNLTIVLAAGTPLVASRSSDDHEMDDIEASNRSLTVASAPVSDGILRFLQSYIPGTELIRKSGRELTYRFPPDTDDRFADVFDALEEERHALNVDAFGISNSSLEEVFLQLAEADHNGNGDQNAAAIEATTFDDSGAVGVTLEGTTADAEGSGNHVGSRKILSSSSSIAAAQLIDSPLTNDERMIETAPVVAAELHHLGPARQIALLYYKRVVVQKRDFKGFFFMIILPVIVIGLVLLILMIDVPLAGPPIEVSMDLYGGTDVVVGGGASLSQNDTGSQEIIVDAYENLSAILREEYPDAGFSRIAKAVSSGEISQYLLETYNDRDHNTRYGAFVLEDVIKLKLRVDWASVVDDITNLNVMDIANLGGFVGVGLSPTLPEFKISVQELSDIIYSTGTLSESSSIDAVLLKERTDEALQAIVLSAVLSNIPFGGGEQKNISADEAGFFGDFFQMDNSDSPGGGLNAEALQLAGGFLDREVVQDGVVNIVDALFESLGVEAGLDASLIVGTAVGFLDQIASPTDVTIALFTGILLANRVLTEITANEQNATITLADAFSILSELLGGSSDTLDGSLSVRVSDIAFDASTMTVNVTGIVIESSSTTLVENFDTTVSLNGIASVLSVLSEEQADYVFDIRSAVSVLHNASSPHAVAAFNQAYMQYRYKKCFPSNSTARLVSVNHPLPVTTEQAIEIQTIKSVLASLFLLIPYGYIPAAFIVFLVKERVSKSKHLQLVSGVNMSSYWVASYLWDLTLWAVLTVLILLVFLMYGRESAVVFVGDTEAALCSMALTFGYGMSALPFSYLLSRYFNNHSSAQIAVMGIFFITGFVAVNGIFIMSSLENTKQVAEALTPLCRTWPAYNIGDGFVQMSIAYFERQILGSDRGPLDWDAAGKPIVLLYGLSLPYFILLLLLEYSNDGGSGGLLGRVLRGIMGSWTNLSLRWHGVRKSPDGSALLLDDDLDRNRAFQEDEDVINERVYVNEHATELRSTASVLLVNLWKIYPPSVGLFGNLMTAFRRCLASICCGCWRQREAETEEDDRKSTLPKRAVRGLSTAVTDGETYGLLGSNGAGKTTLLGILTGDITPTCGEADVAGHDVTGTVPGGVSEARKCIGFCPQVDPLIDLMTGRETLTMYGKLRGIPGDRIYAAVNDLLDRLTLTPHADKTTESYSGGNKRKLSLGIALIGDPRVLMIDEASSGMDPAARRHMWSLIEEVSQQRSSILTTHSMEEAEALCTRVGIMVKGQLLCLGSVQHLKSKYLDGYTIDVSCSGSASDDVVDLAVRALLQALPNSTLSERHGRFLRFDVSSLSSLGLGTTFRRLQDLKANPNLCVENYSISQCSLEQVFIKLVKSGHATADDDADGECDDESGSVSSDESEYEA